MITRPRVTAAVLTIGVVLFGCEDPALTSPEEAARETAPTVLRSPATPVVPLGSGEAVEVLVNPVGFGFGEVQVGSTSGPQIARVINVGLVPIVMNGAGGAPGGDFTAVQNCQGRTLAPGESCEMTFSFSPSAAGPTSAVSAGTWNGQPYSITLSGVGVPPRFQLTPAGIDFGDAQVGSQSDVRTIDVTNVGLADVVMSGAGGAPGGDFSAFQNCQGRTLAPGESCQISYAFSPTSTGPAGAVSSGTWNGQPYSIPLSGIGLAAGAEPSLDFLVRTSALDFARVQVGSTSPSQTVDVVNVSADPVTVSGAGGAPGGDFTAFQNCQGRTLAPGEGCQLTYAFAPSSAGPATAVSSGTWNGQPYSIELSGSGVPPRLLATSTALDFAHVQVETTSSVQEVDILNQGLAPVVVSGAGGAPGGDFNAFQNCQGRTLAPGETCQISFAFDPSAVGPASAVSSGTWNGQPFSIDLSGVGVPPSLLVTPTGLDFGAVAVGTTSLVEEANVINRGLAPVVVSGSGGAPGGDFNAFQNCQGRTLAPSESCQISYSFEPSTPGDASAVSSGTWNGQPYQVALFGSGTAPFKVVDIDIRPGDDPNPVNLASSGGVPVAIFGTADFDVATIDPTTVTLGGAPVLIRPNGRVVAALEDVDEDGIPDLVVHVDGAAFELESDDTYAVLEGTTLDGTGIRGVDAVTIVP